MRGFFVLGASFLVLRSWFLVLGAGCDRGAGRIYNPKD